MSDEDSIDAFLRTLEAGIRDSGFGEMEAVQPQGRPAGLTTVLLDGDLGHATTTKMGEKS